VRIEYHRRPTSNVLKYQSSSSRLQLRQRLRVVGKPEPAGKGADEKVLPCRRGLNRQGHPQRLRQKNSDSKTCSLVVRRPPMMLPHDDAAAEPRTAKGGVLQPLVGAAPKTPQAKKIKSSAVLWHLSEGNPQAGDAAVVLTASVLPGLAHTLQDGLLSQRAPGARRPRASWREWRPSCGAGRPPQPKNKSSVVLCHLSEQSKESMPVAWFSEMFSAPPAAPIRCSSAPALQ
jgi:hypothetical protein